MKLEEIRKLIDAATPGPWTICPRDVYFFPNDSEQPQLDHEHIMAYKGDFLGADVVGPVEPGRSAFLVHDAYFIAASRTLMPKLVALLEEARSFYEKEGQLFESLEKMEAE